MIGIIKHLEWQRPESSGTLKNSTSKVYAVFFTGNFDIFKVDISAQINKIYPLRFLSEDVFDLLDYYLASTALPLIQNEDGTVQCNAVLALQIRCVELGDSQPSFGGWEVIDRNVINQTTCPKKSAGKYPSSTKKKRRISSESSTGSGDTDDIDDAKDNNPTEVYRKLLQRLSYLTNKFNPSKEEDYE